MTFFEDEIRTAREALHKADNIRRGWGEDRLPAEVRELRKAVVHLTNALEAHVTEEAEEAHG